MLCFTISTHRAILKTKLSHITHLSEEEKNDYIKYCGGNPLKDIIDYLTYVAQYFKENETIEVNEMLEHQSNNLDICQFHFIK